MLLESKCTCVFFRWIIVDLCHGRIRSTLQFLLLGLKLVLQFGTLLSIDLFISSILEAVSGLQQWISVVSDNLTQRLSRKASFSVGLVSPRRVGKEVLFTRQVGHALVACDMAMHSSISQYPSRLSSVAGCVNLSFSCSSFTTTRDKNH